jgi:hypothetical protein
MKILRFLCTLVAGALILTSCSKELSQETSLSKGSIQKDGAGDCLPANVQGNYVANVQLTNASFVDVSVVFTEKGNYNIQTSTVNGYFFKASGNVDEPGTKSIRLLPAGRPLAVGFDVFTLRYNGDSCQFVVEVTALPIPPTGTGSTTATFTFAGGNGTNCSAIVNGTYQAGQALGSGNFIDLNVNTTVAGTYTLNLNPGNGYTLAGTGTLSVGPGAIRLNATGTPTTAGTQTVTVSFGANTCTFSIIVLPAGGGGGTTPLDTFECRVNGGALKTFLVGLTSDETTIGTGTAFDASGDVNLTDDERLEIAILNPTGALLGAGFVYNVTSNPLTTPSAGAIYTSPTGTPFESDPTAPPHPANPLKIIVTEITATRIRGTFSGNVGTVAANVAITEGKFNLTR